MKVNNKNEKLKHEKNNTIEYEGFFRSITSIQAITIIGIIIWHIGDLSKIREHSNIFIRTFFEIIESSGDVFIFLSGILLTIGVMRTNYERYSWKRWYGRRIVRIYPILIISTFFYLFSNYYLFHTVFDANSVLVHMSGLQSTPTTLEATFFLIAPPHWYVTLILSCYLLFPLLFLCIKKNAKLTAFLGTLLFVCYLLFANAIFEVSKEVISLIFQKELFLWQYSLFILRYFVFLFGMLLGYWIGRNPTKNIGILQNKTVGLIAFVFLIIIILFYFIFPITNYTLLDFIRILYHPLISISFVFFSIWFFQSKTIINKTLEVPGNETLELFLIHQFVIDIFYYRIIEYFSLQNRIELYLIFIPLIVIISIALALPFFLLGRIFRNERKTHKAIFTLSFSLIIYALIISIFNLNSVISDLNSLLLFSSIIIILSLINIFIFFTKKKKLKFNLHMNKLFL
ncbi:MAG: acyltransferase [Promethearchaeota archaeon]|nr:MAG: acyltransferase [Candidatus Lokiarchaeota archaeon]